jgi:hypothetical membrane protein
MNLEHNPLAALPTRETRRRRAAAALLIAGPAIFLLAEFVTAAFWTDPGYSYTHHFISNLGVAGPSTLFGQYMYSPVAWLMNTGFTLFGLTIFAGVVLLPGLAGWRRWFVLLAAAALATGGVAIGRFPGSAEALVDGSGAYHSAGAFAAFLGGNVLAILLGRMRRRLDLSASVGRALVIVGVVGLVSAALYFALIVSSVGDDGAVIGVIGLIERGATHPFLIALLCSGVSILKATATQSDAVQQPIDVVAVAR